MDQPRWPHVNHVIVIELLFADPIELSFLHAPRVRKRANWRGCGEERNYAALRAAGAVTGFARSLVGVIGGGYNAHRSGVFGCEAPQTYLLIRSKCWWYYIFCHFILLMQK
jgi:hypothetical protein